MIRRWQEDKWREAVEEDYELAWEAESGSVEGVVKGVLREQKRALRGKTPFVRVMVVARTRWLIEPTAYVIAQCWFLVAVVNS